MDLTIALHAGHGLCANLDQTVKRNGQSAKLMVGSIVLPQISSDDLTLGKFCCNNQRIIIRLPILDLR